VKGAFNTHLLVGRVLVSRTDDVGRTVSHKEKRPTVELIQIPKRCCFIKTAARWTWKSSISKACVTTQLPNKLALKIDDAQARGFSLTVGLLVLTSSPTCRLAFWMLRSGGVSCHGASISADLGNSSNYSNETSEAFALCVGLEELWGPWWRRFPCNWRTSKG